MPAIIPANVDTKNATISWVAWDGNKVTSRYTGFPSAATEGQILTVINAAGDLSNAAIYKQSYQSTSEASIPSTTAYDDAISQAERGANVTFQNTVTLATKTFRVPAPHWEHLTADGRFLKDRADDTLVDAFLVALEAALGTSWVFVNAPLSTRGEGTTAVITQPILAEPPA